MNLNQKQMPVKYVAVVVVIVAVLTIRCGKVPVGIGNSPPPAAAIFFEISDQTGKNLITSFRDTAWVTYSDAIGAHPAGLTVLRVQKSETDTTTVSKYGGFILTDMDAYGHSYIGEASRGTARNFEVFINGKDIGTIYYDFNKYAADITASPGSTSSSFVMDNAPVIRTQDAGAYVNRNGKVVWPADTFQGVFYELTN